jgi:hypothetical protein
MADPIGRSSWSARFFLPLITNARTNQLYLSLSRKDREEDLLGFRRKKCAATKTTDLPLAFLAA